MRGQYILDDNRNPVEVSDLLDWGKWLQNNKRRVGETIINGIRISTVFLGLDHQWGDGPPLLFETMVFNPDEVYCRRCSTWEQAEKMHQEAVDWVNGGMKEGTE